jgi:hypothetical protein
MASQTASYTTASPVISANELWSRNRKRTDLGNAEPFADHAKGQLLLVFGQGSLCWDGRRWKRDETNRVARLAADTVRSIYAEAADLSDAGRTRSTMLSSPQRT